ncbi:Copper chaperone CopZ [Acidipropionibacterium virtanenii]|uniref:Copper chaperone CopZ n=1 Tax=Acidipropionibacterium virtanenii TaxID=2057246 RepID=A0A344UXD7_9ACTN|nr:Copper chaperone CopZ [Acidipropionibacterium virtanenii]
MNKTYTINGMTCEHCVNSITKEVSAVDGVQDVTVSLATGSMDVSSDAEIDFAKIADAVDEAGDYTVARATTLDTAGHPGGECGCGGHGHHHSSDAAEKHAAHSEGESCGCGHHQEAKAESCGCGGHEGHHHSSDAAEKHVAHSEGESCGCGHHQAEQHSHVHAADATQEAGQKPGLIGKLLNH